MTAGVADGEARGIGPRERISTMIVVRGAVARLRQGGWRLAVLWLAIFGASWGSESLPGLLGVAPTDGAPYWAYLAATMAVGALLGGLATRLMLAGPAGWLRLDRGLGEYVAISLLMAGALAAIGLVYGDVVVRKATSAEAFDAPSVGWISLATLAAYVVGLFAWFRLTLWPVARLMGRGMTPVRAWPLMRRATRGLALGYLIAGVPLVLLFAGSFAANGQPGIESTPIWAVQLCISCWGVAAYAMIATVYTLRVENPATVAEVFD